MRPDQVIPNLCLGFMCIGWPALWAFVAVNVSRYGMGGWVRRTLERAKASLPPEEGGFADGRQ